MTELRRAERFLVALQERISQSVVPWDGGTAYLHPGLPKVWDVNFLFVDDSDLSAETIAAEADRIMAPAGCEHRRVGTFDPDHGARLEEEFAVLGWETHVHVVMGHVREPDRAVDTTDIRTSGADTWAARSEQLLDHPGIDAETTEQMKTLYDLIADAANARDFAATVDGRIVSFALLYSDGRTGQVEDVATLEAYRNRGISRRVVTKALEVSRAQHDFTFLVADDRDWPKQFYAKLGFDELGRHYYFLKKPQ